MTLFVWPFVSAFSPFCGSSEEIDKRKGKEGSVLSREPVDDGEKWQSDTVDVAESALEISSGQSFATIVQCMARDIIFIGTYNNFKTLFQ